MKVYIISRHRATIELLEEILNDIDADVEVKEHINDINDIEPESIVIGNLPIELINELKNKKNCTVIIISLNIPKELRGKELSKEELLKYMKLYEIQEIKIAECIFTL